MTTLAGTKWTIVLLSAIAIAWGCESGGQGIRSQAVDSSPVVTIDRALDEATIRALHEALDDERRAHATYAAVIEKFGEVRPFSNIIRAEARHAAAVIRLMNIYGIKVPSDRWTDADIEVPDTVGEACAMAAQAEIDNIRIYDRWLALVTEDDIRSTFEALRAASQSRHLPAFQRHTPRGQNVFRGQDCRRSGQS